MLIHCCGTKTPITKYPPHVHDRWEVVCQLEGEAEVTVAGKVYELQPRDILLIPPNAVRKGVSKAGFCDLALRADNLVFSAPARLHDTTGDITALIRMIQRLITERRGDYETVAASLVEAVNRMIKQELGSHTSPAVEQLKRIIYENLSSAEFDLAEHIARMGYHTDHFRRLFKKEVGKTPLQYLTDLRIVHAKQLLSEENRFSIEMVAESCGFTDCFYFSTCFKKHTGLSPLAWRKTQEKSK